jgi:TrmH family RNA methyltransferase
LIFIKNLLEIRAMLSNVLVVLVEPQGPMNVGMAARAMKNCAITSLRLVAPVKYSPEKAHMMACSAKDIVNSADIFPNLSSALEDTTCSFAFTRRLTKNRTPYYSLQEALPHMTRHAARGKTALVFGRETDGLTRDELFRCDFRVYIPTSKKFGSLNLAQAVLLACHSLFMASAEEHDMVPQDEFHADQTAVKPMLDNIARLLLEIGYTNASDVKLRRKIIQALKEIFGRSGLRTKDVNMFHGLCTQVRKAIEN